jgi:hypothetical protein
LLSQIRMGIGNQPLAKFSGVGGNRMVGHG